MGGFCESTGLAHDARQAVYRSHGGGKPRTTKLGVDVAGQVEAVGSATTLFKPGDAVFGICKGAFAEYACVAESGLAAKPASVTFEDAASAPVAGFTALQGLRDKGQLQAGQKVLINGASGGVGTFAVQIAKSFGADVTGVCSGKNVEVVRSIGADQVIDYGESNFTLNKGKYDLMLDCVGNHSLLACLRALKPKGTYVMISGPDGPLLGPLNRFIKALALSPFVGRTLTAFIARPNRDDLVLLGGLMEAGKLRPVIDRRYGFTEIPEAIRYLETGRARGKVVIVCD